MILYTHTQSAPSATWEINHNLNCKPVIEVMVDAGGGARDKIYPRKVQHITDNYMMIEFTTPRTGGARLVGVTGV